MQKKIDILIQDFRRPNSSNVETGIRIHYVDESRSIILDKDFNIVLNCALNGTPTSLGTHLINFEHD